MWKMYRVFDNRISFQNADLELQDTYKVIIYLKNLMKARIQKEQKFQTSFLYQLVKGLRQNDMEKSIPIHVSPEEDYLEKLVIDKQGVLIGWNISSGVFIVSESEEGNELIKEISDSLSREEAWWNKR